MVKAQELILLADGGLLVLVVVDGACWWFINPSSSARADFGTKTRVKVDTVNVFGGIFGEINISWGN